MPARSERSSNVLSLLGEGRLAVRVTRDGEILELRGRGCVVRGNRAFADLIQVLVSDDRAAAVDSLARLRGEDNDSVLHALDQLLEGLEHHGFERSLWDSSVVT